MSIELAPSGFREWHDHVESQPGLGIESARLDACLAHFRVHNFLGLFGNPTFGFQQDNMDFLAEAANARWLWFWDIQIKRIDALYELQELERMGIHPKRPGIDFSRFPRLHTVTNHWIKADKGLTESTITNYYLWHYKPTSKSFAGLEIPLGVKALDLTFVNPASLEGLPVLEKLESLEIHRSRNLSDLSALPRIAPKLKKLLTTTCPRLDTSAGVVDHPTLKLALIDGNHVVSRGSPAA